MRWIALIALVFMPCSVIAQSSGTVGYNRTTKVTAPTNLTFKAESITAKITNASIYGITGILKGDGLGGSVVATPGTDFDASWTNLSGVIRPVVLTNKLSLGSGDDVNYVPSPGQALPHLLSVAAGTAASPFTNAQPLIKGVRTEQMSVANMNNGTANEQNSILNLQSIGSESTEAQVNTAYFVSQTASTNNRTGGKNPDAMGFAATGRILGNGVGYGIGGYFVGRSESDSGQMVGSEHRAWNESATDHYYKPNSSSSAYGILINSVSPGKKQSSVGIGFNTAPGAESAFHVGIGFPLIGGSNVVSGVILHEVQNSTNGLILAGTHTQALSIGENAGFVSIGRTNNTPINPDDLFEIYKDGPADPIAAIQVQGPNDTVSLKIGNVSGSARWGVAGTAGTFMTGTDVADTALVIGTTNKSYHIGGSGNASVLAVKNSGSEGQLGFFSATPVSKQDTDIRSALVNYGLLVDTSLPAPQNATTIYDEFLNASAGTFEWATGVSGTGAAWSVANATGARPGIVQFQSGTTSNGLSGVRTTGGADLFGGGRQVFQAAVRIPTLSDGSETFTVFIGFHDVNGVVGEAVDGAYFTYSSSPTYYITNTSAGSWVGKTADNSNRSETAPSSAVVANQWYTLKIDANAAGTQVDFYIDGTLLGSITTNIPTGASRLFAIGYKIEKQLGLTSRNLDSDYCWWYFKPTTSR